jgi:hypothetical protein
VCFVPVYLSLANLATGEADSCHTLPLPPPTQTISLLELTQSTDSAAIGNRLYVSYRPDDLEVQPRGARFGVY